MDKLVNVSQAADMLGVSTKIMRIWDNEGKVEAVRTAGGHRRYRVSEIAEHCAKKDYHVAHVLTDVGSGMSSNRARLKRLFELVEAHEITKVVVVEAEQVEVEGALT